jgi:hypothetical protein
LSENGEPSIGNVEKHQGVAIDLYEGGEDQKGDGNPRNNCASHIPLPLRLLGMNPIALTLIVDVNWTVAKSPWGL